MVPIRSSEVLKLQKIFNTKLRMIQKNKNVDPAFIASLRLFNAGLSRLLMSFRNITADGDTGSINKKFFGGYAGWEDVLDADGRVLKPVLHKKRYANLGQLDIALRKISSNLTEEKEIIFVLLTTIYLLELYSMFMLFSTAKLDPTFLRNNMAKKLTRSMLVFRKKLPTVLEYSKVASGNNVDPVTIASAEKALSSISPSLKRSLRVLITFNAKLV